jgi:SecD/SecF fusion protein
VENDSVALAAVQQAVAPGIIEGEDTVGPSVGSDLRWAAIWSILGSFVLIILYIWVRFGRNGLGYGLGGVLSTLHDAIVTVGIFALFGFEMNLPFVAAVLTVIGYSLNDSIVIFDRVREQTGITGSRDSFGTRVNTAGNQCLSRSVITHLTTLFTLGMLVALGGSSIRDFAVAMLIGVVVGGYSTYSVASPFVVWWDRRRIKAPAAKA